MVKNNILELLEKKNHTKYWLTTQMDITYHTLNKIILGETKSISFKYIETLCKYLECTPGELFTIIPDEEEN